MSSRSAGSSPLCSLPWRKRMSGQSAAGPREYAGGNVKEIVHVIGEGVVQRQPVHRAAHGKPAVRC